MNAKPEWLPKHGSETPAEDAAALAARGASRSRNPPAPGSRGCALWRMPPIHFGGGLAVRLLSLPEVPLLGRLPAGIVSTSQRRAARLGNPVRAGASSRPARDSCGAVRQWLAAWIGRLSQLSRLLKRPASACLSSEPAWQSEQLYSSDTAYTVIRASANASGEPRRISEGLRYMPARCRRTRPENRGRDATAPSPRARVDGPPCGWCRLISSTYLEGGSAVHACMDPRGRPSPIRSTGGELAAALGLAPGRVGIPRTNAACRTHPLGNYAIALATWRMPTASVGVYTPGMARL